MRRTALTCLLCAALAAAPALKVDRTLHDFGPVPPTAPVTAAFRVENAGDGMLRILRLVPSCECATAAAGKPVLAEAEATTVTVTFDPAKDKGPIERSVYLVTNAGKVELFYRAEVVHPVMASEEALFFPDTLRHDLLAKEVQVKSWTGRDLDLRPRGEAPAFMHVDLAGKGREARIRVTLDGARLTAPAQGILHFSTGIPEAPDLPLEYYAYPGKAVQADPEGLAFDPDMTGKAQAYEVKLTEIRGRAFRVLGQASVEAPFRVEVLTAGAAAEHRLRVSLPEGLAAGSYRGVVRLRVEDPDMDQVEVPVQAELK